MVAKKRSVQLAAEPQVGEPKRNQSTHDLDRDNEESNYGERASCAGELLCIAAHRIEQRGSAESPVGGRRCGGEGEPGGDDRCSVQVGVGSHTLIISVLRSHPIGSGRSRRTIVGRSTE